MTCAHGARTVPFEVVALQQAMKIHHDKPSEHGSFTVEATEGRSIRDVFRDLTTGLLIVEEETEGAPGSRQRFTTTVHPETGQIIPIEERTRHIDYAEQRVVDDETKLELCSCRRVDPTTGDEEIDEWLVKPDGTEVSRRTRIAFAPFGVTTLLENHKRQEAEKAAQERFWTVEYAAKDFAERAAYWAGTMFRHMRWQSESGLDELAGFTPEWFEHAKSREPDFERMFDYLLERYEQELLYQGVSPDTIRRRVGRERG